MNTYPDLYRFAGELDEAWEENEGVDWQEAEDLVAMVQAMNPDDRGELQTILDYAEEEDEWDCDEVSSWPARITDYLDQPDKEYRYRPDGEDWEVYGVFMSGNEDWVATVVTETVAETLVNHLQSPVQSNPS